MLTCKHVVPVMREQGGGAIINISSVSGIIGGHNLAAYNASKGAVRLLTKSVALHCARRGYNIRCNSVHPGATESAMQDDILATSNMTASEIETYKTTRTPMGRFGLPLDIAQAILFLASNDSAFMNGSEVVVDGGYTAH